MNARIARSSILGTTLLCTLFLILNSACADQAPDPDTGDDAQAHTERMAEAHADDTTEPSPAVDLAPTTPVTEARVAYATVDGTEVMGFLARPTRTAGTPPAVIVIHEWWGLNENVEAMTKRLAGEGYVALAVDLYGGAVASDPGEARSLMQGAMENRTPLEDNLRQAHAYLASELGAPRVGVMGWCFGGGWSLQTALLMPDEIDAAVIYYGRVVTDEAALTPLAMPILGHFGSEDAGIPIDGVRAFEAALSTLGKDAQIHIYEGADHAFGNPTGTNYDAAAAEKAWTRTLAFFGQHLKG